MTDIALPQQPNGKTKTVANKKPKARYLIAASVYLILVAVVSYVTSRLGVGTVWSSVAGALASAVGGHIKDGCPSA